MKIIKTKTPKNVVEYDGEEYPANLDPTDIVEIFQTPLTGAYNWDYTVQDNRIKKLYELGKELNWNVEVDVDWSPELSDMMPDTMGIEPDKGDIVFFPSHMIHGVSPHKSDNPRITVSGNITIQDLRTEIE